MVSKTNEVRQESDGINPADTLFSGGGEMGALMRAFDWSHTPIGPVSAWPQSLRTAVRIVLTSRYPMFIWWGQDLINLYNDPYAQILGVKHPASLGQSARETWAEIWDQGIGRRAEAVLDRGESTYDETLLLLMERHGYLEETYFTFSYSPLPDETGATGGLFCAVTEETQQVINDRRLKLHRELGAAMADCRTTLEVCKAAAKCLASARHDLPFSLIYLLESDGRTLQLAGESGIESTHPAAADVVAVDGQQSPWPFAPVIDSGEPVLVENLANHFADLPKGEWQHRPERAVLMPLAQQGQTAPAGVLVAGLNPHLRFGDDFRGFVSVLSNQIAGALANVIAYETERKRAEQLAELDRAKTQFFSNISHEFRTPLTLMLGPLEEVLPEARERLQPKQVEQLTAARRNALRLLKLVNTLLDFSRIEAGRMQATLEPVDLARFTAEIASGFISAMEKAGLRYSVECAPMPEPVYVDRDMWEKIVLNLLSNAFKFTLDGEVSLSLKSQGDTVELTVRDTGVGIPDDERARIFDRFHRVENTRARTYEGSGIGLALVQELVKMHGGTVELKSAPERGSVFTVSIPRRSTGADNARIRNWEPNTIATEAYVDEADRWVANAAPAASDQAVTIAEPPSAREAIVVADDNADMRNYLVHLLHDRYDVHAVSDGEQALAVARKLHPSLVLADVMMPRMDGFALLQAIRTDQSLNGTPVVLLSARAGEESRVEGFQAGADDYLLKPFTARELVARVATHINVARVRRQAERLRRLYDTILSNTPDLAYVFNLQHRFIYANKALLSMWGKTWEEAAGKNCLELGYEPWHAAMHDREIEQVIATRRAIRGEVPFTGTNGRRIYDYIFVPVLGPDGEVEAIAGTTRDITDRTEAEDALRRSEERLSAFVNATSDVVYRMNADWTEMSNLQGRNFIPDTAEPSRDWLTRYIHPDDQLLVKAAVNDAIRRGSVFELEHRVVRVDGTLGWTYSRAIPLRNTNGEVVEWFGAAADITDRKQAEEALRRSEKLGAAGRLAATIAHEINNPLEALTNFIYLASRAADIDAARDYLSAAEEELGRISHLTKQTLGFYREMKGSSTVQVGSTVNSILAVFAGKMRNKGILTVPEINGNPEIVAVPGEVRQLIANLVSNSIDAVPTSGRIRIRVSQARNGSLSGVRITVADSGPGIPRALQAKLFEPFFTTKKEVGTGLGLWVCKSIVEKHKGTIRVKSSTAPQNSWTVFSVFLPAQQEPFAGEETLRQAV